MTENVKNLSVEPHPTDQIRLGEFRVWYHLPISMNVIPGDLGKNWQDLSESAQHSEPSPEQRSYFHSHISETLWGDSEDKLFKRWRRIGLSGAEFSADRRQIWEKEKKKVLSGCRLHGTIRSVELCIVDQDASECDPALGILVVGVSFHSISKFTDVEEPVNGPSSYQEIESRSKMTLANAQDALEWVRRIFPRWWNEGLPGDTLTSVNVPTCQEFVIHSEEEKASGRTPSIFSWINELLLPIVLDGDNATHFGDERAYMTSAILISPHKKDVEAYKDGAAWQTMARIGEGDLFRLAEADTSGSGYPYNAKFLGPLADAYFYNRHAPDLQTGSGNTAIYLMSHHHLCAIGCGDYYAQHIHKNVEDYYRHMQFLAVFEYFRLLQFSKRLTQLVKEAADDPSFGRRLFQIRKDFLSFTHRHHFSNISLQLQPREMYEKLYNVMGIKAMFDEVEQELAVATEFQVTKENKASVDRSEKLNALVAFGIPLTLITGIAGMNILVGDAAPDIPSLGADMSSATSEQHTAMQSDQKYDVDLFQISLISGLIFVLWGVLLQLYNSDKIAKFIHRPVSLFMIGLICLVIAAAVAFFL